MLYIPNNAKIYNNFNNFWYSKHQWIAIIPASLFVFSVLSGWPFSSPCRGSQKRSRGPLSVYQLIWSIYSDQTAIWSPKWCFSKGIFNYRLVDVGGSKDVLMCFSFWRMIVKFIKRLDYFAAGRPWFESTSYIRLYGLGYMLFWGCLIFVFPWLTDFYWLPRTWEVPYWMHDRLGSMDERGHDPFWKKKKVSKFPKKGPLVV